MIDGLAAAITLYALVLAVVALACARRPGRPRAVDTALAVLGVALLGQAVADVAGLVGGHRPAEPAVHVAYLLTSVVAVPVALAMVRGDRGRWATATCALAALLVAVLVVRMQTTWRADHV